MIVSVESDAERSPLEDLLVEFHEWMAANAPAYDPDEELQTDLEALGSDPESWAWIARREGDPAGCVLLHGESDSFAEFRRLWVTEDHRGAGLGRALTEQVIETAQAEGYETLGLTTPPWADASHALYASMGFEETPPYPATRLPEKYHDEAIFMQLSLDASAGDHIER